MARTRVDGLWVKNAAGVYVQAEPVGTSVMSGGSTGDVLCIASDDTVEAKTITAGTDITVTQGSGTITIASTASGGGGGSSEGMEAATLATPSGGTFNATISDHFDDGSIDAKWQDLNVTSLTASEAGSCLVLDSNTNGIKGKIQAVPAADSDFTVLCRLDVHVAANFQAAGLVLYESSSAKKYTFDKESNTGQVIGAARRTSTDTFSADVGTKVTAGVTVAAPLWLAITYDGTNYAFLWSPSGVPGTFATVGTDAKAAWFTTAATDFGLFVNPSSGGRVRAAFDVFFVYDSVITL